MSVRAAVILLLLGTVWGASFLFIKVVVEETSPVQLAEGRIVLGALAVAPVLALRRPHLALRSSILPKIAVIAVFGSILPFLLIAWGEIHIESGTASVLNSSMPLFTAVFAALFLAEERLTLIRVAGLSVGFIGIAVLTGGDIPEADAESILGDLAVVAAAASYGAMAVFVRATLASEDPLVLSALQLAVAGLLLAPLLAIEGIDRLSLEASLSLLTLGVMGTGFALVAYYWLLEEIGSVRSSLVTYIIPLTGVLLGWAVLDESIGLNTILGGLLIILGVVAVARRWDLGRMGKLWRRQARPVALADGVDPEGGQD